MHHTHVGIRRQGSRVNHGDDIVLYCLSEWCCLPPTSWSAFYHSHCIVPEFQTPRIL